MQIFYTRKAREQLQSLSKDTQKRIAEKMRFYAAQQDPLKFAVRLTNYEEGEFRFRIGDYGIFFDVIRNSIYVLKIKCRDKAY